MSLITWAHGNFVVDLGHMAKIINMTTADYVQISISHVHKSIETNKQTSGLVKHGGIKTWSEQYYSYFRY